MKGKKVLLKDLFDLPASAFVDEIVNATLQLLRLPSKELKQVGHHRQEIPSHSSAAFALLSRRRTLANTDSNPIC